MRALVIDDSRPVRSIIGRMLRSLSFDVTEAADGNEALASLDKSNKPEIALVNWHMPNVNGLEFVRAVRSDPSFRSMPLLIISGDDCQATVDQALAAGANDFLSKPLTEEALRRKLLDLGLSAPGGTSTRVKTLARQREPVPAPQPSAATPARTAKPARSDPDGGTILRPIRVLIVDDSAVVRRVVGSMLSEDPEIELAGTASDGQSALDQLATLNPDLILLDIEMPGLDGFDTLRELRRRFPRLPVLMFSSLTERGAAATIESLMLGANDYVPKPGGPHMKDIATAKTTILEQVAPKIKQLVRGGVGDRKRVVRGPVQSLSKPTAEPLTRIEVVAIATSTGGPQALKDLLPAFANVCPVPIVIVQHMPPTFTAFLAKRLDELTRLTVVEAGDEDELCPGRVFIAPGGLHLAVKRFGTKVMTKLTSDPPENSCRPSADVLFRSIAAVFGPAALAIVLTGMGQDGLDGCHHLRSTGARILAQDEATSLVWGMPGSIVRAGLADRVLPLNQIGPEVLNQIRRSQLARRTP